MAERKWDMTSAHSLEAAAEWLRKEADALVVVVIRAGDGTLAADGLIDVMDVHDRLWQDVPKLLGGLRRSREEWQAAQRKREAKGRKGA